MKIVLGLFIVFCVSLTAGAHSISSDVEVVTLYSQNEKFYLKSIPFDNEIPSFRGRTLVYKTGSETPLYVLERGFDVATEEDNNLFLSNDGEVIFYVVTWGADEEKEGLKSVNVYRNGKLAKSYTETEITGCDRRKERCSLIYFDNDKVPVTDEDRFLDGFPVFSSGDTLYLTDSKLVTHFFDLKTGALTGAKPFVEIFGQIKDKGRLNKIELQNFDAPSIIGFPKLKSGKEAVADLANYVGMKPFDITDQKDEQYKWYRFRINASLRQDGILEIEETDIGADLPKEKILEFFKNSKFDAGYLPKVFEKWYLGEEYVYLRKADDRAARQEKLEQNKKDREELEKRLVAEKIKDVYIPKDMGECFTELDRLLSEVDRREMQALSGKKEMIRYHFALGMWLRNNWGLWSGSRLQKYFTTKGVTHPDEMSGIILEYYHDWLNGRKETWKDWENNPKQDGELK